MKYFKKSLAAWGCISFLVISFVSCKKESIPTGMLYGKIFYQGTTVPVPDVVVEVNGLTATSSLIGYYMIKNIPLGEYVVHTRKTGFDSAQADVVITTSALEHEFNLTSEWFTNFLFGKIHGNITGNPQSNVNVILLNPDGQESLLKTVSGWLAPPIR